MTTIEEIRDLIQQEHRQRAAGDREAALRSLELARSIAERAKNAEYLSEVENAYGNHHCRYTDIEVELKHRRRSVALLGPKGHPLKLAVSRSNLAGALVSAGEYVEALKYLYLALDHYTKKLPDHTLLAIGTSNEVPYLLTTIYSIANLHILLQDHSTAHEYLKLHHKLVSKHALAQVPDAIGLLVICSYENGDLESAERYGLEQLELAQDQRDGKAEAMAWSALSLTALKRGELVLARERNATAMECATRVHDRLRIIESMCNQAEIEALAGNFDGSIRLLDSAAQKIDALRTSGLMQRVDEIRSTVYEKCGNFELALKHFKLATQCKEKELYSGQQHEVARMHEARVKRSLAEEKKLLTQRLSEIASAMPPAANTEVVHQLLQLAPTLSRTELRICELLAIGSSTKQIAQEMSASRHTVDGHRTAIRKKLGIGPSENLSTWLMRIRAAAPVR